MPATWFIFGFITGVIATTTAAAWFLLLQS